MRARLTLGLVLVLALGLGLSLPASAQEPGRASQTASSTDSAAQQLADRYVPIVRVRTQPAPCSSDGEPFVPMPVDPVLGNPHVALRVVGKGDPVVKWAPTASDLYESGSAFYLDLPGDALKPGCGYEQDERRLIKGQPPTVYAHVVQQPGHPDDLAVQYWLYWYFNDWNNVHESDWEFIQVNFSATSAADALTKSPVSVGYAQHEGGESASWTSDKLQREGTHPVVYSSERSHASYFSSDVFLGRGASTGFGCDDTDDPTTRLTPVATLLPDKPSGPDDPAAWLSFQGNWGERHGGPNNGPTGPTNKPRWDNPVDWQSGLRASSFTIPAENTLGTQVVNAFCAAVAAGSQVYIYFVSSPGPVLVALAILILLAGYLVRRTAWNLVDSLPVVRERRVGQIARAAVHLYRSRPLPFALAGAVALPIEALAVAIVSLSSHVPLVGPFLTETDSESGRGGHLFVSSIAAGILGLLAFAIVNGVVAALLGDSGTEVGRLRDSVARARGQIAGLVLALVIAGVVTGISAFTVIGLPLAVFFAVRYQYLAQVCVLEGRGGLDCLSRSAHLVRHRWWRSAVVGVAVYGLVTLAGILVGLVLLLLFTGLPLWALSILVGLAQVLVLPLGALVLTLAYGDARAEALARSAKTAPVTNGEFEALGNA